MPKYVIERELPGAGKLTPQELNVISQKSCSVLNRDDNASSSTSSTTTYIFAPLA